MSFLSNHLWGIHAVGILLGAIAAFLTVIVATIKFLTAIYVANNKRKARRLQERIEATNSVSSFTQDEIADALRNYIEPDCAQTDPSNESDLRHVAEVREPVMVAVDRFINHGAERRFILILADSGMGKTTFCLNYYARLQKRDGVLDAAIISLGRPDAVSTIKSVKLKNETILILDALAASDFEIAAQSR